MLDRIDPRSDGDLGRLVAVAVRGGLLFPQVRLVDDRRRFVGSQLGHVDRIAERKHAARDHELDHVGAVLELPADRVAALVGPGADARLDAEGREVKRRGGRLICVAAARPDRVFRDQHPRTLGETELDAALQAEVRQVGGGQVSHRRDSAQQRAARVDPRLQRLLGGEPDHPLDEGLGEIVL